MLLLDSNCLRQQNAQQIKWVKSSVVEYTEDLTSEKREGGNGVQ